MDEQGQWFNDVKVIGAYVGESPEKKTPFFALEFNVGENKTYEWKAWLTNTKDQKTGETLKMKNLKILHKVGFAGKDLPDMADPDMTIGQLFGKPEHPINVLVKPEHYEKDGETKTYYKIEAVTVSQGKSKFDKAQSVATFKSLNTAGDLALIRQRMGANKAEPAQAQGESFSSDDIPF